MSLPSSRRAPFDAGDNPSTAEIRAQTRVKATLRWALETSWPGHPRRWRDVPRRIWPTLVDTFRLTTATVLGYLLSAAVTGSRHDLTGALTALLVVQASSYGTLRMGFIRVMAVLTGVLVALGVSTWVGLTWFSLAAAVGVSLVLAKVLRLDDQRLEVAISAMLILAVKRADVAAESRLLATLLGSVVGIAFALVFASRRPHREAASQLRAVTGKLSVLLRRAAEAMQNEPITQEAVDAWADEAHAIDRELDEAADAVAELADARKFNPHALVTVSAEPTLRVELQTLQRVSLAVQALFATIGREAPLEPTIHDGFGDEIRPAFAVVVEAMGNAVKEFGEHYDLELPENRHRKRIAVPDGGVDAAVDELRETRAILTELMLTSAHRDQSQWLLRGSVLAAVEHVLDQLDIRQRSRLADVHGARPLEG